MNIEHITELFRYHFRPTTFETLTGSSYVQFNFEAREQKHFLRIIGSKDVKHCNIIAGYIARDGKSYAECIPIAFVEALLR